MRRSPASTPNSRTRSRGPSQALQDDPAWRPLATRPNVPEYPSERACYTAAVAQALAPTWHRRRARLTAQPGHPHDSRLRSPAGRGRGRQPGAGAGRPQLSHIRRGGLARWTGGPRVYRQAPLNFGTLSRAQRVKFIKVVPRFGTDHQGYEPDGCHGAACPTVESRPRPHSSARGGPAPGARLAGAYVLIAGNPFNRAAATPTYQTTAASRGTRPDDGQCDGADQRTRSACR